ncbi:MAG: glycosyltransferase family 4 protein [Anaerolineales bacterium]|nr:glycosyltransferase family 4 protein [Anaerolineales bacterium]
MHILLIHQVFVRPDDPGGTRHYEMAHWLVKRGHRITILASPYSYQTGRRVTEKDHEVLEPGLEVVRCRVWGSVNRSFFWRTVGFFSFMLSAFIRGMALPKIDLVWGTSPPLPQVFTAWLLARCRKAKFLFEIRDLWPAFAIQLGILRNPVLIRLALFLEGFLYRRADRLVVNSPGFFGHLEGRGADAEKIVLIRNGVDPSMFDPTSEGAEFRKKHGLDERFVALYAGAHGVSNDLTVLLDAAEILRADPRICFLLVGDGKEKPALALRAAERKLENVRFLPPVAKQDMAEVLAAGDCGIAILKPIPLYGTTYPNKVFDYMAAGRPVVLAIDGVIRQVVEEARAGVAVPPGNAPALAEAVRRLADDPSAARKMGARGRSAVERGFGREGQAREMEILMGEMTASNVGAPRGGHGR